MTTKKTKAIAPQDAAVVVKRSRKPAVKKATPAPAVKKPARRVAVKKSMFTDKTAPDGGNPSAIVAAIAAAMKTAGVELNGTQDLSRKDVVAAVVSRELPGEKMNYNVSLDPNVFVRITADAITRAAETIGRFDLASRENLQPYVTLFERFWGFIEHRVDFQQELKSDGHLAFLDTAHAALTHGEYARYTWSCGSRAIVVNTVLGAAALIIEDADYVKWLRTQPIASPELIEKQKENTPTRICLTSNLPRHLTSVMHALDDGKLRYIQVLQVFGDPFEYALCNGGTSVVTRVDGILEHIASKRAA